MKTTIARVLAVGAALGLLALAPQTAALAGPDDRLAGSRGESQLRLRPTRPTAHVRCGQSGSVQCHVRAG